MRQLIIRGDRTKGKLIAVVLDIKDAYTKSVTTVGTLTRVDRYRWEFRPANEQPRIAQLQYLIIQAELMHQTEETKHLYWTIETKKAAAASIRRRWLEDFPLTNKNFRGFKFDPHTGLASKTVHTKTAIITRAVRIESIIEQLNKSK